MRDYDAHLPSVPVRSNPSHSSSSGECVLIYCINRMVRPSAVATRCRMATDPTKLDPPNPSRQAVVVDTKFAGYVRLCPPPMFRSNSIESNARHKKRLSIYPPYRSAYMAKDLIDFGPTNPCLWHIIYSEIGSSEPNATAVVIYPSHRSSTVWQPSR